MSIACLVSVQIQPNTSHTAEHRNLDNDRSSQEMPGDKGTLPRLLTGNMPIMLAKCLRYVLVEREYHLIQQTVG